MLQKKDAQILASFFPRSRVYLQWRLKQREVHCEKLRNSADFIGICGPGFGWAVHERVVLPSLSKRWPQRGFPLLPEPRQRFGGSRQFGSRLPDPSGDPNEPTAH